MIHCIVGGGVGASKMWEHGDQRNARAMPGDQKYWWSLANARNRRAKEDPRER